MIWENLGFCETFLDDEYKKGDKIMYKLFQLLVLEVQAEKYCQEKEWHGFTHMQS